jgi:UDP-glucuronate decarboxylase
MMNQLSRDSDRLRSKRIAVTGGAGFLGSSLCDILISSKASVDCIDNLSTGLLENIEHLLNINDFRFQNFDIVQPSARDGKYDLILHFASHASPEEYQRKPIETLLANSEGTLNMLELSRKHDATLVYASSSEVYGNAEVIPTPETYWGNVNPIGPRSCYDEGKRFGEALCMAYHRAHGLDVRIVRIFNSYGPRLRSDGFYARALSRFIEQALSSRDITIHGRGDQTRSFCYVTDTLTAIVLAATRNEMKGEVLNIGNPHEVSILELAEKIKIITESKSKVTFHSRPPDDPQRRCPDISKANKLLGWSPTVTLDEGLRKTVEWFKGRKQVQR